MSAKLCKIWQVVKEGLVVAEYCNLEYSINSSGAFVVFTKKDDLKDITIYSPNGFSYIQTLDGTLDLDEGSDVNGS